MAILSVFFLFLPLPIITVVVFWFGIFRNPKQWPIYIWLFLYPIFIFAYCIEPSYVNDLSRYFMQLEKFGSVSFREAFQILSDGLFVRDLLFWLIAKTKNVHLLPAVTTSIMYAICMYITCDSARRMNKEKYIGIVMVFEVLVIPYFNIVCNIRNVTAFALICLAGYRDMVHKKRNLITLILYIAPCFLHKTGFVLIILRLLVIIFERYMVLSLAIIAGVPIVIDFAYSHVSWIRGGGSFSRVIRLLILSSHNYLYDDSEYAARLRQGTSIIRLTVFFLIIVLAFYCFRYVFHIKREEYREFITFAFTLCVMTVACAVFDTPAYWRFAVAAYISCAPILLIALSRENKEAAMSRTMFLLLGTTAILRFAMSLRYNWTRMDFDSFALKALITNAYTVIYDVISGLRVM